MKKICIYFTSLFLGLALCSVQAMEQNDTSNELAQQLAEIRKQQNDLYQKFHKNKSVQVETQKTNPTIERYKKQSSIKHMAIARVLENDTKRIRFAHGVPSLKFQAALKVEFDENVNRKARLLDSRVTNQEVIDYAKVVGEYVDDVNKWLISEVKKNDIDMGLVEDVFKAHKFSDEMLTDSARLLVQRGNLDDLKCFLQLIKKITNKDLSKIIETLSSDLGGISCNKQSKKCAEYLFKLYFTKKQTEDNHTLWARTIGLVFATNIGSKKWVKKIIEKYTKNFNPNDLVKIEEAEYLLLNVALKTNQEEVVEYLLELGADPFTVNNGDPLELLVGNCNSNKIVQILYNAITNKLVLTINDYPVAKCPNGNTLLLYAVAANLEKEVKLLLKYGADVNAQNSKGETPLFYCKTKKMMQLLVEGGADINVRDNDSCSCLFYLVWYLPYQTRFNSESLRVKYKNMFEMIELLLSRGANDLNAIYQGILKHPATFLHHAVETNNIDLVKLLLKYNPDLSIRDFRGYTVLHALAWDCDIEIVKLLVNAGADINALTRSGQDTPLSIAKCNNQTALYTYFLSEGAKMPPNRFSKLARELLLGSFVWEQQLFSISILS